MEGMAPAVARFKRQRLAEQDKFASPDPEPQSEIPAARNAKTKVKKEVDISAHLNQHRQREEERARQEKEDLANLPDDVDLAEIRRLNIVEEMEIRRPGTARTREQDIADGRWNPKWNGMKNFKKFRKRGEATGRPPVKQLIQLQEVKNKEFGVGDDFWLEDEEKQRRNRNSQRSVETREEETLPPPPPPPSRGRAARVVDSESGEEDEDEDLPTVSEISAQPSRSGVSQTSTRQTTQKKRPAPAPDSATEQAPKRVRPTRRAAAAEESDDSDDELKFRFGRRRK
jgi:hypothetical protein